MPRQAQVLACVPGECSLLGSPGSPPATASLLGGQAVMGCMLALLACSASPSGQGGPQTSSSGVPALPAEALALCITSIHLRGGVEVRATPPTACLGGRACSGHQINGSMGLCPNTFPRTTPSKEERAGVGPVKPRQQRLAPFQESPGAGLGAQAPLQLPPERVFAVGPEEVDVGLELQLEDVLLVDAVRVPREAHAVAQQREAGQWVVVLEGGGPWSLGRCPAPAHPQAVP